MVTQGLLENPPPSDNPHNIIVCGDDQDAVAEAKQLIDCQPGFKASCSQSHAIGGSSSPGFLTLPQAWQLGSCRALSDLLSAHVKIVTVIDSPPSGSCCSHRAFPSMLRGRKLSCCARVDPGWTESQCRTIPLHFQKSLTKCRSNWKPSLVQGA